MTIRQVQAIAFDLTAMLGASGCVPIDTLKTASAGHTGCAPEQISISNVRSASGGGLWNATCNGKTYLCSDVGTGKSSAEISCALARQLQNGCSWNDALARLRRDGANIVERIASVKDVFSNDLTDAKRVVNNSSAWSDVAERTATHFEWELNADSNDGSE
jgi:hypothetical protein